MIAEVRGLEESLPTLAQRRPGQKLQVLVCRDCRSEVVQAGWLHLQRVTLDSLEVGSPRSRCSQVWLFRGLSPWLADNNLAVSLDSLPSVYLVPYAVLSSDKDTNLSYPSDFKSQPHRGCGSKVCTVEMDVCQFDWIEKHLGDAQSRPLG